MKNQLIKYQKNITLVVDMYGCPNRCKHCWIGDVPNNIMPNWADEYLVNLFKPYFENITYYSWLREPDFTNDYENRWEKDNELSTIKPQRFELASFYRLTHDNKYIHFLKKVGTKKVQLTFFGLKALTDKYVGRIGAYEELLKATKILKENDIEPRWQIFINEENKNEIHKLIQVAKEYDIQEIMVHEGSCDGNNYYLYDIRINKKNIPPEVLPYYLNNDALLNEQECCELLKNDSTHFLPQLEDNIILNITSDFNIYYNYTNPSKKWLIGNALKDDIECLITKIIKQDVEAINISKRITLSELVSKYSDFNSDKVFSLDDYKMYLLNKHLSTL